VIDFDLITNLFPSILPFVSCGRQVQGAASEGRRAEEEGA
jgi:hypothetical protein